MAYGSFGERLVPSRAASSRRSTSRSSYVPIGAPPATRWVSTKKYRRPFRARNSSIDRKSTRLNSSHVSISYAVFCLKKKKSSQPRTHAAAVECKSAEVTCIVNEEYALEDYRK